MFSLNELIANLLEPVASPIIKNENPMFQLPITFLDPSCVFPLSPTVSNDLELTCSNLETKSIYEYMFKPSHEYARKIIPHWNKHYTNNIDFLTDTKQVLENIGKFKTLKCIHSNNDTDVECPSPYTVNCEKLDEIWNEAKNDEDFLSKYSYIEWDMIKYLNLSPAFLQGISFINLTSPIMSLLLPFLFLLFPFIILKLQGVEITFELYKTVLMTIAQNHFIGQALSTCGELSPEKMIYIAIASLIYVFQIYQNVVLCKRFYDNMRHVNEYLIEIRDYIGYSIKNMENFMDINDNVTTYRPFLSEIEKHATILRQFHGDLVTITPFSNSVGQIGKMGTLLKHFYELHDNKDYDSALQYSFGFEGYIDNLLGVFENLESNIVSFATFDSSNCEIKKQYYPPLMDASPVKNDCKLTKNAIISSPNAGGKTTMIKATTINIIFTQQLGCGFYSACSLKPYTHIHSYLNIPDTSGRDSLFQAESRRCKEIIDIISLYNDENQYRHFCIFDELYSGTNPVEATKSAYAFILYLCKFQNVNFMLTTHYVSICSKLKKSPHIQNYKMEVENLESGDLKYTYKMKKGISKIQGAITVLKQMDYPKEIIDSITNYGTK
jgi:hypothetical protein